MPSAPSPSRKRHWLPASLAAAVAALLAACRSGPQAPVAPQEEAAPQPSPAVSGPVPAREGSARLSAAATPRAYRQDAATHVYGLNTARIYRGRMPPLLYAIGVLQVDIDGAGRVTALRWMRAPRHASEVMVEIERTVRAAAPYPVPARMGNVTWTDTWLWHKSGQFQLDTLTEGQD